jgi:hypothetical protein
VAATSVPGVTGPAHPSSGRNLESSGTAARRDPKIQAPLPALSDVGSRRRSELRGAQAGQGLSAAARVLPASEADRRAKPACRSLSTLTACCLGATLILNLHTQGCGDGSRSGSCVLRVDPAR